MLRMKEIRENPKLADEKKALRIVSNLFKYDKDQDAFAVGLGRMIIYTMMLYGSNFNWINENSNITLTSKEILPDMIGIEVIWET